jgi:hypothetical protein
VTPSSGVVVKHSGQNSAQLATMMAGQICRLLASPEKLAVLSAGAVARAQDFILAQRIKRFYDRAIEFMPARAHSTEAFYGECSDQTDVPEMARGGRAVPMEVRAGGNRTISVESTALDDRCGGAEDRANVHQD